MGTSVERASAMNELFRRGESFGIKGYEVDGMDHSFNIWKSKTNL